MPGGRPPKAMSLEGYLQALTRLLQQTAKDLELPPGDKAELKRLLGEALTKVQALLIAKK